MNQAKRVLILSAKVGAGHVRAAHLNLGMLLHDLRKCKCWMYSP